MIDDFKPVKSASDTKKDTTTESETTTENFLSPEEMVAQLSPANSTPDVQYAENTASTTTPASETSEPKPSHSGWPPSKKTLIITAAVIIVLGGVTGIWLVMRPHAQAATISAKSTVVSKPKPVAAVPTTVPSTLSGLPVAPATNNVPVTGVMVENTTFARPQSGLSQANVVFEAIAEAGITRFLALYQDTAPTNVGPIRSVRPYYEQWALGFDASIAHVGGSPEALADLKTWNVKNLDEFYNGSSYHRISTRQAPHNMYTAVATLNQLEASKGYTSVSFTGFPRKKEAPAKKPTAVNINLTISSATYNVLYTYNPATNSYNRNEGGAPQIDANTNTQLSPKVVIAMIVPYSLEADGYHSQYGTIGSGPVYVFQDGTVTTGVWAKSSNTSQITFKQADGSTIKLNPGQTWLTALAKSTDVTYTP